MLGSDSEATGHFIRDIAKRIENISQFRREREYLESPLSVTASRGSAVSLVGAIDGVVKVDVQRSQL